jgi:hypothetical protein
LKQRQGNGAIGVVHAVVGELADDVAGAPEGSGEPVEFGHHEGVAGPARSEFLTPPGDLRQD